MTKISTRVELVQETINAASDRAGRDRSEIKLVVVTKSADIEAVLIRHEDVREVAVIGVSSKKWGETPYAVIVPRPDGNASAQEIIAWANGQLGKQQRVAGGDLTDALPRNPNGKVLKRELRKQYRSLNL